VLLVDSSVWIEAFRKGSTLRIDAVLPFDEVVTCPVIVQEVLQGFREEHAFRVARGAMLALPMVESPVPIELHVAAAELYRAARRAGITPRSSVDCLIAETALRHDLVLVHADRDYELLSRLRPLRCRKV
jgi:predicted nucleic acid-binding protein